MQPARASQEESKRNWMASTASAAHTRREGVQYGIVTDRAWADRRTED